MKIVHRLALIVACAVLGLVLLGSYALHTLRSTMLEDRRTEVRNILTLAGKEVEHYQQLERAGKLTQAEAQARAIETLTSMRDGNRLYVWSRSVAGVGLVHPKDGVVGKVDFGITLPNGRTTFQNYLDHLQTQDLEVFDDLVVRPGGSDKAVPKLNGAYRVRGGWEWLIGYGVFVDDIDDAFWSLALKFMGMGAAMIAAVLGLAYGMSRSIYRQLGGEPAYAVEVARAIASGDLSRNLAQGGTDDNLIGAIATMQGNLREMIQAIQHGAADLGSSASSLSKQMADISHASEQSADATTSTAAAIQEMAVSIDHISSSARETEANSSRSNSLAAGGEQLVIEASETIQKIAVEVEGASEKISALTERSLEIGGVAGVIGEIAAQTNLLALNAAIEAARAGEQGRGFAVVADEVRKLAERTTTATKQITDTIGAIQTETASAVESMGSVTPRVAQGVDKASAAAQALRDINTESLATLNKIRDVASATAEQSEASASVARNVERISQMAETSSASVAAANGTVQGLRRLSTDLLESVSRFRL